MITSQEMKELEEGARQAGVSSLKLMENAGKEVAAAIEKKFPLKNKRVLVVCYHGNNGGDGFVAARYLADKAEVEVLFLGQEDKFRSEAKENFNLINEIDRIQFISLDFVSLDDYDIIIDAMLGTGTSGLLKSPFPTAIDAINSSKAFKVSVDVPTGLNPDTGKSSDKIVNADMIVTFHDLKKGLKNFKSKTVIADIGIPSSK